MRHLHGSLHVKKHAAIVSRTLFMIGNKKAMPTVKGEGGDSSQRSTTDD